VSKGYSKKMMRRAFELRNRGASFEEIQRVLERELGHAYTRRTLEDAIYEYKRDHYQHELLDTGAISYLETRITDETISLIVICDSHVTSVEGARELVDEIRRTCEAVENPRILFLGDIVQMDIVKPGTPFGADPMAEMTELAKIISEFAPVTVGVVVGNHEERLERVAGIDPMKLFCTLYGVPYLGCAALIRLSFPWGARTIYAIHGSGGGKRIGAKANKLEDLIQVASADIYLHAHTHEFVVFERYRIEYGLHGPFVNKLLLVNLPARQKYPAYVAKRGYPIAGDGIKAIRIALDDTRVL